MRSRHSRHAQCLAGEQVWRCHSLRLNRYSCDMVLVPSPVMRHHLLNKVDREINENASSSTWDERRARGSTQFQHPLPKGAGEGLLLKAITGEPGIT